MKKVAHGVRWSFLKLTAWPVWSLGSGIANIVMSSRLPLCVKMCIASCAADLDDGHLIVLVGGFGSPGPLPQQYMVCLPILRDDY